MRTILDRILQAIAYVAANAVNAIEAIDAKKQDKSLSGSITIPSTGWGSDGTASYPKYYDISISGVTILDRPSIDVAPFSMETAVACGFCPTCESLNGKVRVRAATIPAASISAEYTIEKRG